MGVPGVDRLQCREHLQHGGLPGPVRTEHAEALALADLEVDAVDGAELAKRLNQAGGGHAGRRHGGLLLQTGLFRAATVGALGFTAATPRFRGLARAKAEWSAQPRGPSTRIRENAL